MIDILVGKKVIGIKQASKAIKNGRGTVLYVAKDADKKLISPLIELTCNTNIKVIEIDNMKNLGKMCGVDVKSSAVLMLE